MNKEKIINLFKSELDKIEDYDDKVDYIIDNLPQYSENEYFDEILKTLYEYVREDFNENIDPRLE